MPGFKDVLTERLRLTALTEDDLEQFHALHSDPATYRDAPEQRHPDLTHSRAVLDGYIQDWRREGLGYWAVRVRRRSSELNGLIGVGGVRLSGPMFNVYYLLRPDSRGRGYAREVVRAAARCVDDHAPQTPMQAAVRPWNNPSRAVAEAVGMVMCGQQFDHAGKVQLIYQADASMLL